MDADERAIFERIADSLARLADHFVPVEATRKPKPAVLGNATYSREDRAGKEVRQALRGEKPQPAGRAAEEVESDF